MGRRSGRLGGKFAVLHAAHLGFPNRIDVRPPTSNLTTPLPWYLYTKQPRMVFYWMHPV